MTDLVKEPWRGVAWRAKVRGGGCVGRSDFHIRRAGEDNAGNACKFQTKKMFLRFLNFITYLHLSVYNPEESRQRFSFWEVVYLAVPHYTRRSLGASSP